MKLILTLILFVLLVSYTKAQDLVTFKTKSGYTAEFDFKHFTVSVIVESDGHRDQAYQEIRNLVKEMAMHRRSLYDIYVLTPKATYYANYSFKKKLAVL